VARIGGSNSSNLNSNSTKFIKAKESKMQIRKAERKKAKLRLGIAAPSGAGKTYSALLMALGIGGKVGLIDTEHGSGDLYAHLGDYDVISIEAPYTVAKYTQAIKAFEEAGYTTIIVDSLSHAWSGDGGLLDKQGKMADRGTNSFAAWRTITPEHNALVDAMLQSHCHIIATMRSKQEYVLEANEKGKQQPKKVGMAPVQREGMEYEFTVMLDVDMNHIASASKDRTSLFDGRFFKISQATGQELLAWLETGIDQKTVFLKSIQSSETIESLKSNFGSAWRISEDIDKPEIKAAYDKRTNELTEKAA
jgi:hypothetical protein